MITPRFAISRRTILFIVLAAFLVGGLFTTQAPFVSPAAAKGVVKTQPRTDSSDEREEDTQKSRQAEQPKEEPKPSPPAPTRREDSSPAPSDRGAFTRREERRDTTIEQPTYRSPQQRSEGTPDIRGQIIKREERRDPEYEYRKHYVDPFFHPYDYHCYSYYPYYDRGAVIIIDRDTWNDTRRHWRRSYEYSHPAPGSLDEALVDIEATWWERDAEFLMWHIDHRGMVDIYRNGKYSHSLSPREIFKLTDEAVHRIRTIDFHFTSVRRHSHSARARARHEYLGPDKRERVAYLDYYLKKVRERWVIDRIDIRRRPFGSPNCFIATAAFGTPMEEEVLVLRQFRDNYLLTNRPGRAFVAVYYKISPPIAEYIRECGPARAVVRAVLKPIVQLCEAVVPKAGT